MPLEIQRKRVIPMLTKDLVILGSMLRVITWLIESDLTRDSIAYGGGKLINEER